MKNSIIGIFFLTIIVGCVHLNIYNSEGLIPLYPESSDSYVFIEKHIIEEDYIATEDTFIVPKQDYVFNKETGKLILDRFSKKPKESFEIACGIVHEIRSSNSNIKSNSIEWIYFIPSRKIEIPIDRIYDGAIYLKLANENDSIKLKAGDTFEYMTYKTLEIQGYKIKSPVKVIYKNYGYQKKNNTFARIL